MYSPTAEVAAVVGRSENTVKTQLREARAKLRAKVGRTLDVLVDEMQGTTAIARSKADAPEIDGIVRVKAARSAKAGDILHVKVTAADEHDLEAQVTR